MTFLSIRYKILLLEALLQKKSFSENILLVYSAIFFNCSENCFLLLTINKTIKHKKKHLERIQDALWPLADSNCRHTDFQSDALPTELRSQYLSFESDTNIRHILSVFQIFSQKKGNYFFFKAIMLILLGYFIYKRSCAIQSCSSFSLNIGNLISFVKKDKR